MIARFRGLVLPVLAIGLSNSLAPPVIAHEEHQQDMTDAEMVQMEMGHNADADHHAGDDHYNTEMLDHHDGEAAPAFAPAGASLTPEQAMDLAIAENRATSASDVLGRLHPVAAHFPIALLLAAAIAELMLLVRPSTGLKVTSRFLVAGGAAGAVVAALLGWTAGGWRLSDRSETLGLHRWNGSAIAALAILATWLAFRSERRTALRVVLLVLAVTIVAQGYLGGEMVFGPNHLGLR